MPKISDRQRKELARLTPLFNVLNFVRTQTPLRGMELVEDSDVDWDYLKRLQQKLRKWLKTWQKSKWQSLDESDYLQRHFAIDRQFLEISKRLRAYDVYRAIHSGDNWPQVLSGNLLDAEAEAMRLFLLFLRSPVRHTVRECAHCGMYFGNLSGLSKYCCREHKTEFINERNRRKAK
jgi:hypothetical protein